VAAIRPVKSSVDLIVSRARGNALEHELRPVFSEVQRYYAEHGSELGDLPDDDPVIADVIIADMAAPLIERFEHWFETFACLLRRYEDAGYYQRISRRCIVEAFTMLREPTFESDQLEDTVVMKWMEMIAVS
jgi:hypothetical protein